MSMTVHRHVQVSLRDRRVVPSVPVREKSAVATAAGLAGGIAMALPIVIYGWASGSHSALELPMAATSWLFGLEHFAQNGYLWGSIVLGIALLAGYALVHGVIFAGFTDRFLRLRTLPERIGAGLAWGFVSWLFFWYTLLPIARDGAPFRATAESSLTVAPTWVFIIGFTVLGVATSLAHWIAHRS
jgi:hypothetical protein